jgi:hypothetical protein
MSDATDASVMTGYLMARSGLYYAGFRILPLIIRDVEKHGCRNQIPALRYLG